MVSVKQLRPSAKDRTIDAKVIADAHDPDAWGKEQVSNPSAAKPTSIRLSSDIIQKAKLFARIHHARGYQSWLKSIVEERIEMEYKLYRNLKKEIR